ncbi:hypothetical protein TVAG_088770 [Trichomonas vaginalis G3]|uniref:HAT C-terminal dimerisation domain-containing protein n=1 Tax=Trichomonas vaginalis (strain ATCC PRA-98 / G3) TaxID=412133 RepID=A2EB22_TRIV3|nr:hypothetical protein TVAG_088770 [Trichomonas vaginalis G3]|eukprot:XP_001322385.1 hypothetical protein [Trichomonas vaginalis G3]
MPTGVPNEIPKGYVPVKYNSHHKIVRCATKNAEGKQCLHQFYLESYNDNKLIADHTCYYTKLIDFDKVLTSKEKVLQAIEIFIGCNKISFNAISSDSFRDLVEIILEVGMTLKKKDQINDIIKSINRAQLTEKFLQDSKEAAKKSLSDYFDHTISLLIDAGTACGRPTLDLMIYSPSVHDGYPFPLDIKTGFDGTTDSYDRAIRDALAMLASNGIKLGTVVTDNLLAQVLACDHNFVQTDGFLRIPCAAHTLSLAMEHEFPVFENLNKISLFLRSKPVRCYFKVECPLYVKTRWTSEFDIILWLVKHYETLKKLTYQTPARLKDAIQDVLGPLRYLLEFALPCLFIIFYPVYELVHLLERDETTAANTIDLLVQYCRASDEFSNAFYVEFTQEKYHERIHDIVAEASSAQVYLQMRILARFEGTGNRGLLELANSLTFTGREQLRQAFPDLASEKDVESNIAKFVYPNYPMEGELVRDVIKGIPDCIAFGETLDQERANDPNAEYQPLVEEEEDIFEESDGESSTDEDYHEEEEIAEFEEVIPEGYQSVTAVEPISDQEIDNYIAANQNHSNTNDPDDENTNESTENEDNTNGSDDTSSSDFHDGQFGPEDGVTFDSVLHPQLAQRQPYRNDKLRLTPQALLNPQEDGKTDYEGLCDLSGNSIDKMSIALYQIAHSLDYDDTQYVNLLAQYRKWIKYGLHRNSFDLSEPDPYKFWKALVNNQKWKELARIAVKLLSAAATEAAVERLFSYQKHHFDSLSCRASEALVKAKMIFLYIYNSKRRRNQKKSK